MRPPVAKQMFSAQKFNANAASAQSTSWNGNPHDGDEHLKTIVSTNYQKCYYNDS